MKIKFNERYTGGTPPNKPTTEELYNISKETFLNGAGNTIRIVYGTLRKGYGLHKSVGLDKPTNAEYLGEITLKGFDMWTNGFFPYVKRGTGTITAEVYNVLCDTTLDLMDSIEAGAGYTTTEISISDIDKVFKGSLYLYNYDCTNAIAIPSGNFKDNDKILEVTK